MVSKRSWLAATVPWPNGHFPIQLQSYTLYRATGFSQGFHSSPRSHSIWLHFGNHCSSATGLFWLLVMGLLSLPNFIGDSYWHLVIFEKFSSLNLIPFSKQFAICCFHFDFGYSEVMTRKHHHHQISGHNTALPRPPASPTSAMFASLSASPWVDECFFEIIQHLLYASAICLPPGHTSCCHYYQFGRKGARARLGWLKGKWKCSMVMLTPPFSSGPSGCYSDQNKAFSLPSFGIVNCFCSPLRPLFLIVQLFLDGCASLPTRANSPFITGNPEKSMGWFWKVCNMVE